MATSFNKDKLHFLCIGKENLYQSAMVAITHLRSLQALDCALAAGSLKAGADMLAITPAALGQRIKTLEDYLGVDLLVRGRSGLKPTPELEQALPHLQAAFASLGRVSEILDFQRTNEIHIAANSDLIDLWLVPRLPAFREAHPNILFCLNGEGDVPVRLGAADIEMRFAPVAEERPADLLFHDRVAPVSTPENIRRTDELNLPSRKDRLEGFPLFHLDFYKDDPACPDWSQWVEQQQFNRTNPGRGIRYQRIAPALDAILAGAGYMICGLALIAPQIESSEVCRAFPEIEPVTTSHAFQARFRRDALNRPQIQRFRTWLLDEAAQTREWLEANA